MGNKAFLLERGLTCCFSLTQRSGTLHISMSLLMLTHAGHRDIAPLWRRFVRVTVLNAHCFLRYDRGKWKATVKRLDNVEMPYSHVMDARSATSDSVDSSNKVISYETDRTTGN